MANCATEQHEPHHKLRRTLLTTNNIATDRRECTPDFNQTIKHNPAVRKISFPADSIINAVIQDGDVLELLKILRHQRSEVHINQANHVGLTALHHAVLANNIDSVKLLLNYGADVRVQDVYGFSPLHTSAALGFVQITSLLIVFGADVFSLTKQQEFPVDVAKDISVIRLLTNEMCLKVHQELLVTAFLSMKCKTILIYVYRFTSIVFHTMCTLFRALLTTCVSLIGHQSTQPRCVVKPKLISPQNTKYVSGDSKEFSEPTLRMKKGQ